LPTPRKTPSGHRLGQHFYNPLAGRKGIYRENREAQSRGRRQKEIAEKLTNLSWLFTPDVSGACVFLEPAMHIHGT
jgi:hypothetical protein